MARIVVRVARQAVLVLLFAGAALLGTVSGVFFAFAGDLPQISALDDYAPNTITRVLASNGEVVGEFAIERRVVIPYEAISPKLRQAILASEDEEFDRHFGLSIPRIIVALVRDILEGRKASGASTLTQQLARNLFLTPEKTWERKIKEAILAIQIEKRYTKPEIFTLYCNQIYLGHGAYGVEAASRLYFGKSASDLTLDEAAMIAGIIQSPSRQSPYVDVRRATIRRNYALGRMASAGYITAEEAEAARQRPIVTTGQPTPEPSKAPYYVEEVRKYLEAKYGAKQIYENGLTVQTALDVKLQEAASRALDAGLRAFDRRRGWRRPARNLSDERLSIDDYSDPRWSRPMQVGDVVPAVVTATEGTRIDVRVGRASAAIGREGYAWTRRTSASALVRRGDVVSVRLTGRSDDGTSVDATLEQEPIVEGAVLALENRTGRVLAMVGGYSFERSKFNRATQAMRQMGSTFKPVVYTAAIDRGYTPASTVLDAPVSFPAGPGQPPYSPSNYDNRFEGTITVRRALEQSRNIPAVRLTEQLGPAQVVAYARRLGFASPIPPYLSVALGAAEATLLEATSAFSVFPNQGVRMMPFQVLRITDREGNLLEENRPQPQDAIRADTAFVVTNLLQGVVARGTAARAAALRWPLGGKTGTTNDYTDAWFIGFDPDITVGVWIGHDQKRKLGPSETGGVAALPIWMDVMRAWIEGREDRPEFARPGNILFVSVDRATGREVAEPGDHTLTEVFISGTQPGAAFPR